MAADTIKMEGCFISLKILEIEAEKGSFLIDQQTGKLFKQGTHGDDWRKVRQADYQITQVRTYKGIN